MSFQGGRRDTIAIPGFLHELAGLTLPGNLMEGLEAAHIFTGTAAQGARNWAPGKPNGVPVGNPVGNGKYLAMRSGRDYIRTGINDIFPECTVMTFGRHDPAEAPIVGSSTRFMFAGSYDAVAGVGMSLYSGADTDFRATSRYTDGTTPVTEVAQLGDNPRHWGNRVGLFGNADKDLYARNLTLATSQPNGIDPPNVRVPNGRPICFGSDPSRIYGARGDLVFGFVWSRFLTVDDLLDGDAWGGQVVAPLGLTD